MINIPSPDLEVVNSRYTFLAEIGIFVYKHKCGIHQEGDRADFRSLQSPIHRELKVNGKYYQACRVAYYLSYGEDPSNGHVFHLDSDPSNNKPDNLRLVTEDLLFR